MGAGCSGSTLYCLKVSPCHLLMTYLEAGHHGPRRITTPKHGQIFTISFHHMIMPSQILINISQEIPLIRSDYLPFYPTLHSSHHIIIDKNSPGGCPY